MKTVPLIALVVVLSFAASFAYGTFFGSGGETQAAVAKLKTEVSALDKWIETLREENAALKQALEAARTAAALEPAQATRVPMGSFEEAVDGWMREHRPDLLAQDASADAGDGDAELQTAQGTPRQRATAMLALLDQPDLDDDEWEAIWKQIADAGLIDEAIAILEERVAADPENPDAHVALAGGYLGKLMNSKNTMEMGTWAMKADAVLDKALGLDPHHWQARFTKAVSLSFFSPVLGKQGEAVKNFEILLEQQRGMPRSPGFAQTYLFLGNLHQQMGNHEKAREVWADGLALFPEFAELQTQLDNAVRD